MNKHGENMVPYTNLKVIPARIFLAKDGRAHIILNKEAVNLLRYHDFPTQGYLYLEMSGGLAVLKKMQSAEIPNSVNEES